MASNACIWLIHCKSKYSLPHPVALFQYHWHTVCGPQILIMIMIHAWWHQPTNRVNCPHPKHFPHLLPHLHSKPPLHPDDPLQQAPGCPWIFPLEMTRTAERILRPILGKCWGHTSFSFAPRSWATRGTCRSQLANVYQIGAPPRGAHHLPISPIVPTKFSHQ